MPDSGSLKAMDSLTGLDEHEAFFSSFDAAGNELSGEHTNSLMPFELDVEVALSDEERAHVHRFRRPVAVGLAALSALALFAITRPKPHFESSAFAASPSAATMNATLSAAKAAPAEPSASEQPPLTVLEEQFVVSEPAPSLDAAAAARAGSTLEAPPSSSAHRPAHAASRPQVKPRLAAVPPQGRKPAAKPATPAAASVAVLPRPNAQAPSVARFPDAQR